MSIYIRKHRHRCSYFTSHYHVFKKKKVYLASLGNSVLRKVKVKLQAANTLDHFINVAH